MIGDAGICKRDRPNIGCQFYQYPRSWDLALPLLLDGYGKTTRASTYHWDESRIRQDEHVGLNQSLQPQVEL